MYSNVHSTATPSQLTDVLCCGVPLSLATIDSSYERNPVSENRTSPLTLTMPVVDSTLNWSVTGKEERRRRTGFRRSQWLGTYVCSCHNRHTVQWELSPLKTNCQIPFSSLLLHMHTLFRKPLHRQRDTHTCTILLLVSRRQ